jgi:phosphoenolpyruvate-protein kinase (PTS system EI component)
MSKGYDARVVVEIKLSDNTRLQRGYEKQLEKYKTSEKTTSGVYVVVVISDIGEKDEKLLAAKNNATAAGAFASELVFIDGSKKAPASRS